MNIVLLSVLFRDPLSGQEKGGGEISNRLLLERLGHKHQVTIVSAVGSGLWGETVNNIVYYDLSAKLPRTLPFRVMLSKLLFRTWARRKLSSIKPDVVLSATQEFSPAHAYAARASIPCGCIIRAFENRRSVGPWSRTKDFFKSLVYGDIQAKGVRKMHFVVANSEFMKQKCIHEYGATKVHVVYPPIDLPEGSDELPERLGRVLMVSTAPKKGLQTLLELAERFPDIEFNVLGSHTRTADERCPENVVFHGWVRNPIVHIRNADLVLVPSLWEEPFGRIAVEALLCRRPVLASNVGGLPEALNNAEQFLIDPLDASTWCSRLAHASTHWMDFVRGAELSMKAAQRFCLERQAQLLEQALLSEIEEGSRTRELARDENPSQRRTSKAR